jgi:death-on-curing protein
VKVKWVSLELTLAIHGRQLAEHGGQEGVRDMNGLQSALARPENQVAYAEKTPSLFQLAAAYAFGICKNHPFLDGNKRTAAVVCMAFLEKNGIETDADEEDLALTFERLAEGGLREADLAKWLEEAVVSATRPQTPPPRKNKG